MIGTPRILRIHVASHRAVLAEYMHGSEFRTFRDVDDLDSLMRLLRIDHAYIDAMPDQRFAQAFCDRHRGKAWLA
jgi:hypothetical protein